ncbi:MAG: Tol-Pal system protein TolB, partial [Rhodobacteraceae bacterium]|nr:Tol-Pal system protein TolB [Paracoccaceae bacterium]
MFRFIFAVFIILHGGILSATPLRIEITQGVIEPMPFAVPVFIAETPNAVEVARNLTSVVRNDLTGTGLFREIPSSAHVSKITSFSSPVQFSDWQVINADALITGSVSVNNSGKVTVMFRVYDVFSQQELGSGLKFSGSAN